MSHTTAHRVTVNRAPMNYRARIEPLKHPSLVSLYWPRIVGTTVLLVVGFYAMGLALEAVS
jgi:hypothetical protein